MLYIIVINCMTYGYRLEYIHVMDIFMNVFVLADCIDIFAIVAIGAGCPDALYF